MIKGRHLKSSRLVLIVDDQEINRDVLGMILEDDYELLYATNGQEAMDLIEKHQSELSIVLLDLIMPVMNGFEVLSRIHNSEFLNRIPVIVLTADNSAELKALQMGAADFIKKPFDVHEVILARVERIIELSEGRQLISSAEHDRLTQLYNRNFFFEYANRIFRYHPDWQMDSVVINIEHFHSVNALLGREFGDDVLRCLGQEIRSFLSEHEGIGARFEADRFDLFLKTGTDFEALLTRLQKRMNSLSPEANIRLRMGVKPYQRGINPVMLFDQARTACNMIRGNSQSHLMIFDQKMLDRELYEQRLINDLRRALEEHEFKVYYQPKYNIQCNPPRLSSAEALIRWIHPELGMVSPGDFIPLLEGSGQITKVDYYVWREAAAQIAAWKEEYGVTVPVSVNVSRIDLFDPQLFEKLTGLVEEFHLEKKALKLEVTESAYAENTNHVIDMINQLRGAGFEIEMDDFGSGYSSLNMLSYMPIDVLKMDMKFIRNIEHSEKDFRLVELILNIAKYLNVPVVAEGVETERQMSLLKGAECDIIQGYYFSRPLPAEDFQSLIIKEKEKDRRI